MPSALIPQSCQIWPDAKKVRPPQPGTEFQVIGCGLPRTGTTSFGEAISILLNGPTFDGGHTARTGPAHRQKLVNSLVWDSNVPQKDIADRTFVLNRLAQLTQGYVGTTDAPGCYMVEELLQLYPNAKVICTVREREPWWKSYSELCSRISRLYTLCWGSATVYRYCMYCLGVWRHIPHVLNTPDLTAKNFANHQKIYDAHAEYIKRVVPKDKLYYFSVKDGWEPLCKILDVPVPDIPFPRANNRQWMDDKGGNARNRLRVRIAVLLGGATSLLSLLVRYRTSIVQSTGLALLSQLTVVQQALSARIG